MLFAGNILMHPCFNTMRKDGEGFRVVGELKNTDIVMNRTFWIGVYPGMSEEKLSYMVSTMKKFVNEFKS